MTKKIPIFISLFYITFYLPFISVAYNSSWYKLNCNFHERCEIVGKSVAYQGMEELTGFLLHKNELVNRWTNKEILHLHEVRDITDFMFIFAIISAAVILYFFRKKEIKKFSLINIFVICLLFLVMPFFATFWREIFHSLLFDNMNWLNTRFDLSYYIMPRKFFKITVGTVLTVWLLINLAIWYSLKRDNP